MCWNLCVTEQGLCHELRKHLATASWRFCLETRDIGKFELKALNFSRICSSLSDKIKRWRFSSIAGPCTFFKINLRTNGMLTRANQDLYRHPYWPQTQVLSLCSVQTSGPKTIFFVFQINIYDKKNEIWLIWTKLFPKLVLRAVHLFLIQFSAPRPFPFFQVTGSPDYFRNDRVTDSLGKPLVALSNKYNLNKKHAMKFKRFISLLL